MENAKRIEQVSKKADIIVLDEGINKKGIVLGPDWMCCVGFSFPYR